MKNKKKLIAGATLGVVAGTGFVGASASADEVVATDNPATNLVTTQPVATPENTNAAANTGVEVGDITTPIESTGLNDAVVEAENTGVLVEKAPVETVETIEEADTNLQNQEDKVEAATETAKEVTKTTTEAESKANDVGVELKEEAKVVYKDDNKAAILDAAEQVSKLETATNAQNEINKNLPTAQAKAREAGVTVTISNEVKYEDARQALADLSKQVSELESSASAQSNIDSALALAVASARKLGLNVELSSTATFKDVQTALKAKDAELQKLVDAEQAQNNANKTLADAAANARVQGTVVKNTGTETVSAEQAEVRAQELAKRIADIVTTNKEISEENARKQAEYEAEVERIKEENRRIDLRNTEIRLENSRKKADYEKALADLKADQETVANQNTIIRAENERRQAEYEAALKALEAEQNDVAAKNEAIRAENERRQAEYEAALKALEAENSSVEAQNEAIRAENARKQAEYEKALAEANTNNEATAERNQEIEAENARKLKEYYAALKEAQDNAQAGYFSKEQIKDFLASADQTTGIRVLNPASNTNSVSFDKGSLEEIPANEVESLKAELKFADDPRPVIDTILNNPAQHLYKVRVGDTFSYSGLFGDDTVVKFEVSELPKNNLGINYSVVAISEKSPSFDKFQLGRYGFKVSFLNPDGTPRVGNYIIGVGDVDNSQTLSYITTPSSTLYGEVVNKVSDNTFTAKGVAVAKSSEVKGQVWAMFKNTSSISYTYSENDVNAPHNFREVSFWHELGGIDFQIDTPTPPKLERATPLTPVNVAPPTYEEELTPVEREIAPPTPTPELPPVEREITPPTPTPELPPVEREITPPTYENELPPVENNTTPPTPEELREAEMKNLVVATNVTPVTIETDSHKITMVVPVHDVEVATTVNPVQVKQTPSNSKAVNNAEGVDVDKQLVAKSSTIKWVLSNESLKGGRDYTVSYVMTDPLPKGFELNLLATAEATPDYNVKYDGATHTVTFIAKDATIFNLNADVSKAAVVPVATVVGTVLNDGATYQNTFTTTVTSSETVIVDKNGKTVPNGKTTTYKITSNTPEVYTPGSNTRTYNGNVVVRYFTEKDGKAVKIAPNQVDLEDAKVGTKYDTTDQKAETIAFEGKTYQLTTKVVGSETGDVIRGTIYVDYYYEVVPEVDGQGNVIVHYHDEDGNTISNDVVDTPNAPIGTDYTTTDNKPNKIITEDGIEYELVPDKTIGKEDGKVKQGTTEVTYVYKRITPKPETPTPFDNLIEPSKHIYTKDGQQVDGKTLLPNTEVTYTAVFDLDQFKGMTATAEDIAKGIAFFDDLQDNTVSINVDGIVNKLADGTVVTELVATQYNSVSEAPEALQAIIEKSGISLDGQFIAWVPVNPTEFYNKYIVTGQSIYHTMPITVGDYVGTFQNKVWQVVFGNGYEGNIVENNIPKLEVLKDAVKSVGSNESISDGNVELGQTFPYVLDGPAIQANIVGGLQSYVFTDDFDENHDEYNGEFYAFADQDIKLKDGTVIKAGDEITRYFVQNIIRNEEGVAESVTLSVDPAFLASIAEDGVFDPKVYLLVNRIAYAENVENTVKVSVNGYEVTSNTVVTHTPEPNEPEKPVTPNVPEKPATPVTPTTPVAPANVLPSTGDNAGSLVSVLGMALLSILGLLGLKKRKEN